VAHFKQFLICVSNAPILTR